MGRPSLHKGTCLLIPAPSLAALPCAPSASRRTGRCSLERTPESFGSAGEGGGRWGRVEVAAAGAAAAAAAAAVPAELPVLGRGCTCRSAVPCLAASSLMCALPVHPAAARTATGRLLPCSTSERQGGEGGKLLGLMQESGGSEGFPSQAGSQLASCLPHISPQARACRVRGHG